MKCHGHGDLCVEWESTNTSWHINFHHVKFCIHMKCEVRHNWDMGNHYGLMGGTFIYSLMCGTFIA